MEAQEAPKDLIDQFVAITNSDRGRASFFLEASNNDINEAVAQFFASNAGGTTRTGRVGHQADSDDEEERPDTNELYVGGAGRQGGSGQNVIGPNSGKKPKKENDEIIQDMFNSAKEHGAEQMETARSDQGKASKGGKTYFGGASSNLAGQTQAASASTSNTSKREEVVVLRLWKNGFTVGDGPLRDMRDPANEDFMKSIMKGEVPQELRAKVQSGRVALDMEDHRDEDYKKPKVILFSGGGNSLADSSSNMNTTAAVDVSNFELKVDESAPLTQIRIRLCTGQTIVQKFNKTNTVLDLRKFVASKSSKASNSFKMMTTFPKKVLEDDSVTLEAAGLLNTAIVQQ